MSAHEAIPNDVAVAMKALHITYAHSLDMDSCSPRDMMRHLLEIAKIRIRRTRACNAASNELPPPAAEGPFLPLDPD